MSILTNIEFVTNDGTASHVISIEDARKLYVELHELFGPTPVPVTDSVPYTTPYNPWIGPNPYTPYTDSVPKGPIYPIGSISGGPLTSTWSEWSAIANNE
jgi:hypothetical protein